MIDSPRIEATCIAMEAIRRAYKYDSVLDSLCDLDSMSKTEIRAVRSQLAQLYTFLGNTVEGLDFQELE